MSHFDVTVVDDGSTDGGGSLVKQVSDSRFRLISQENRGGAAARNRGIAESHGSLIAFLDADDEWAPAFLECILALAKQYPGAGLLATGFHRCYGGLKPDRHTTLTGSCSQLVTDYFRCACDGEFVTSSSVAVRREVFARIGRFPEGVALGEDRDMWARIALCYPIGYDTRILATYHLGAEDRSCNRWKSTLSYPAVVRSLRDALAAATPLAAETASVEAYIEYILMEYVRALLAAGDRQKARQVLRSERFEQLRFRAQSVLLRAALGLLPTAVIAKVDGRLRAIHSDTGEHAGCRHLDAPRSSRQPSVVTYTAPAPHDCPTL